MKKKLLIVLIVVLVIFICNNTSINNYIKYQKYQNQIRETVINKFGYIDEINFTEKNFARIDIIVEESFEELNYSEKEMYVQSITETINDITREYCVKVDYTAQSYDNVFINCKNDIYSYFAFFKKNNDRYDKNDVLREDIIEKHNFLDSELHDALKYFVEDDKLQELSNLESKIDCQNEIFYLAALDKYKLNLLEDSKKYFNYIDGNYKEKEKYLQIINSTEPFQGTWRSDDGRMLLVFDGYQLTYNIKVRKNEKDYSNQVYNVDYYINIMTTNYEIQNNNKVILENNLYGKEFWLYPHLDEIQSEDNIKYSFVSKEIATYPEEGMTSEEVRNSILGPYQDKSDGYFVTAVGTKKKQDHIIWYYESETTITKISFKADKVSAISTEFKK